MVTPKATSFVLAKYLSPELGEKLKLEQDQTGVQEEEEKVQGDSQGGLSKEFDKLGMSSVVSTEASGGAGQKDETCVEESPDRRKASVGKPFQRMARASMHNRSGMGIAPLSKKEHEVFDMEEAQKITNGIVMQINEFAGQLFEIHDNIFKLITFKPRRVYKHLAREYQDRIERAYGENILRHVVLTQDFCFPSEDYTG